MRRSHYCVLVGISALFAHHTIVFLIGMSVLFPTVIP